MKPPWCCVIGCDEPATYEIGAAQGEVPHDGGSHACDRHVADLLPDGGAYVRRFTEHEVSEFAEDGQSRHEQEAAL